MQLIMFCNLFYKSVYIWFWIFCTAQLFSEIYRLIDCWGSAKSRARRACVLACLTYLRTYVLTWLRTLHARVLTCLGENMLRCSCAWCTFVLTSLRFYLIIWQSKIALHVYKCMLTGVSLMVETVKNTSKFHENLF